MTELIRAYPAAAPVLGDLLAKNLDWPDADEIAKRLQALLPAAANGGDGQANAMVAKLQQQIALLMAQLQGMQNDRALDAEKLRIDAFRAETDRLKLTADIAQKNRGSFGEVAPGLGVPRSDPMQNGPPGSHWRPVDEIAVTGSSNDDFKSQMENNRVIPTDSGQTFNSRAEAVAHATSKVEKLREPFGWEYNMFVYPLDGNRWGASPPMTSISPKGVGYTESATAPFFAQHPDIDLIHGHTSGGDTHELFSKEDQD